MNANSRWLLDLLLLATWALALVATLILPEWLRPDDPGDGRVRQTIRLSLACWFVAVLLMPDLDLAGWRACGRGRLVRWVWTLGWATYLIHVGLAYHHAFGWSQTAALAHTRARSGVGEGIYVSYVFTLVWGLDVVWWWLAPAAYAGRSPWWDRLLHGFLAFIIFNGTVVYETGAVRWVGAAAFTVLGVRILLRRVFFSLSPDRPAQNKDFNHEIHEIHEKRQI
jgi:hypothetical protein